jgi:hypothetical protein
MTLDDQDGHLRAARFPVLSHALERHMCWAFEHALAGEDDDAASVLRDVHAIASEIVDSGDSPELSW